MTSRQRQLFSTHPLGWVVMVCGVAACVLIGHAQQPPTQPETAQDDPVPTTGDPASDDPAASDDPVASDDPIDTLPVFRAGINVVRVDAIVTDGDGNHVSDLQASDFEVYEDGVLQTVESFDLVEISAIAALDAEPPGGISNRNDVEREAARADVRVFVIFFDDYHVRWGNGQRASMQITEFLQKNLIPTDLVAVMYPLTPLIDLRFTRDHERIIDQVNNWYGRKYDYEPLNVFEQEYVYYPTETVELIRNAVSLSAINALTIHLGGIRESRKNVLLVSEGYTYYVPPELRGGSAILGPNQGQTPVAGDSLLGTNMYEDSQQVFAKAAMYEDLKRLYSSANRFNTAFYTLDPRGLAVFEFDLTSRAQSSIGLRDNTEFLRDTQDTLRLLADQTDGRAIVNQNDFIPGLDQMLRDASAYYLLAYNSALGPTDGEFHEIEVRVKRDGVKVRNRPGYWAMSERDVRRALEGPSKEPPRAIDRALNSLAEPRRGYLVKSWVGTSRGDNGRTKVTFVWEPTRGQSGRDEVPARVLVTAMGESGGSSYRGRVPEPEGASGRGLAASKAGADGTERPMVSFEADPGTLQMSLAVEGETGEVIDRTRDEIEIPDFTGPDLVLSTPAFFRARNNLEWQQVVTDWDAIPAVARDFRRTERILLRVEAYAPGTTEPDVTAWLLNRQGTRMFPLVVQPAADGHPYQVDIQPAGLAPGDYVIELKVTTSSDELVELVAFRLRS